MAERTGTTRKVGAGQLSARSGAARAPEKVLAAAPAPAKRDFIESIWVLFCSVRFAVVLNIALALAILIGTLLPQMQPGIQNFPEEVNRFLEGARSRYGDLSGPLFWAGFYDLYNSLWFRLMIATTVFSIIICTLNRWQPTMRLIRNPMLKPTESFLNGMSEKATFRSVPLEMGEAANAVVGAMKGRRYRVQNTAGADGTVYLYGSRDAWSKMITFVSHAALVLFIITAAGMTNFGWRETSVYFPPGVPVNIGHGQDYSVRNDGFSIDYYEDGKTIKEYRNTLAVIRDGQVEMTKTIIVNDPLRVGDVNYFLVSYVPSIYVNGTRDGEPVVFTQMGDNEPAPVTEGKGVLVSFTRPSAENLPVDILQTRVGEKILTFELTYYQDVERKAGENPPVYARVYVDKEFEKPVYDSFVPRTGSLTVPGYEGLALSIEPTTTVVLEVAKDPGLGLLAFFFMVMAGGFTLSLYMTFARCWVRITPSVVEPGYCEITVAGLAERNKVSFERDFELLAERIKNNLASSLSSARAETLPSTAY
jgi:cytochrome c biogenesis protein ResB